MLLHRLVCICWRACTFVARGPGGGGVPPLVSYHCDHAAHLNTCFMLQRWYLSVGGGGRASASAPAPADALGATRRRRPPATAGRARRRARTAGGWLLAHPPPPTDHKARGCHNKNRGGRCDRPRAFFNLYSRGASQPPRRWVYHTRPRRTVQHAYGASSRAPARPAPTCRPAVLEGGEPPPPPPPPRAHAALPVADDALAPTIPHSPSPPHPPPVATHPTGHRPAWPSPPPWPPPAP